MKLTAYSGHIRNWESLCRELKVDAALPRKEREAVLLHHYHGLTQKETAHKLLNNLCLTR